MLNGKNLKLLFSEALQKNKAKKLLRKTRRLNRLRSKIEKLYDSKKLKLVTRELAVFMELFFSTKEFTQELLAKRAQLKLKLQIIGEGIRQHHFECNKVCVRD